jgi:hypothetical protein
VDKVEDWWWKNLATLGPIVASAFAFAFVVGYFSAFDITWIPFFSLSEHVVLALRALPVAIAGSVALHCVLRYPEWGWFKGKGQWLLLVLLVVWVVCLLAAATASLLFGHIGLCVTFLFIAASAIVYYKMPPAQKSTANVLYWASNLWVLTLMIGFLSGYAWKFEKFAAFVEKVVAGQPLRVAQDIELKEGHVFGHVIAAGNTAVLFYDFDQRKVRLLDRRKIEGIAEGTESDRILSAERWR